MRSALATILGACLAFAPAIAQPRPTPVTPITNLLPSDIPMDEYALTADGNRVYYSTIKGEMRVYDRRRNTSSHISEGGEIWDVTVAPNGSAAAFVMDSEDGKTQIVWTVPLDVRTGLATGPQRRVSMIGGDRPSFSPDGRLIAFAREDSTWAQSVVVVPTSGGPERVLASFPARIDRIRWTPDAKTLYFSTGQSANPTREGTVQRIPVGGGTPKILAQTSSGEPGLSPDGRTLVFRDTGFTHAYVVADTNGKRLTTFAPPSATSLDYWLDGKTLLAARWTNPFRLRRFELADGRTRILMDTVERVWSLAWSPDGKRVAFGASIGQHFSLFVTDALGGAARVTRLTESISGSASWSPDGRWILYHRSLPAATATAVAVEVATGRQINTGITSTAPALPVVWSDDSRRVIVATTSDGPNAAERTFAIKEVDMAGASRVVREVNLAGNRRLFWPFSPNAALVNRGSDEPFTVEPIVGEGRSVQVLPAPRGFVAVPIISADRKWVALRRNTESNDNSRMTILDVAALDGSNQKTLTLPFNAAPGANVWFLPGNKQLVVAENPRGKNSHGVYLVTIASGEAKQLFSMRRFANQLPQIALSPDGKSILYVNRDTMPASYGAIDVSRLTSSKP